LDARKVQNYLEANGCQIIKNPESASVLFFFGCTFNRRNEQESLDKLKEISGAFDKVFCLGGLADLALKASRDYSFANKPVFIPRREFSLLDKHFKTKAAFDSLFDPNQYFEFNNAELYSIQVSRGCLDNCAYCGDKLIVGELKSKPLSSILEELRFAFRKGKKDIELLGDDVGAYGIDIGYSFCDLLKEILAIPGEFSLRIQEINVKYLIRVEKELPEILDSGRIKQLTIAFQSGNDRILKLMNRGYNRNAALKTCRILTRKKIKKRFHAIVGFPTETWKEFMDTASFIEEAGFEAGTIFKYEDRDYTPAWSICPKVADEEIERRMQWIINHLRGTCSIKELPDKTWITKEGE
jgi:tRNA A37 methylthiotransferase MiaB